MSRNTNPQTLGDLAANYQFDQQAVAADQQAIANDNQLLATDQANLTTDTAALGAVVKVAPFFVSNADGTITGFESDGNGGVKPTTFQPSSAAIPTNAPAPSPAPAPVVPATGGDTTNPVEPVPVEPASGT